MRETYSLILRSTTQFEGIANKHRTMIQTFMVAVSSNLYPQPPTIDKASMHVPKPEVEEQLAN